MTRVLVTGASGQLGRSIKLVAANYPQIEFVFREKSQLDISDSTSLEKELEEGIYQYCINCAAYTNVEMAEKFPEKAYEINSEAVKNLANFCKAYNTILIHISTDYVFDGRKKDGYTIEDKPNPINKYGKSKLIGEQHIMAILERYFIIRTSWLYSNFKGNFYTTIINKAKTEPVLYVTDEQTGCPTHASNLASYILGLIDEKEESYGIHHFTDGVAMSWYGFARNIIEEHNLKVELKVATPDNYRTFAARPENSVLL